MVDIKKDRKSDMWIITRTDGEGFHHQIALSESQMNEIVRLWTAKI